MTTKPENKPKVKKQEAAKAESKAKDLPARKSPKGGDGTYWGKIPNHNLEWLVG